MSLPHRPDLARGRHAGLLVPLASIPSGRSWGIGEIPDLEPLAAWLRSAGLDVLQLLPINEMAAGQCSPYSAVSAMAIDPVYVSLADVEEFGSSGGEAAMDAASRSRLASVRAAPRIEHEAVRALKRHALRSAFGRFFDEHWNRSTTRSAELARFIDRERWWLDDYALFRAIRDSMPNDRRAWTNWPAELRDREPEALGSRRDLLSEDMLFHQYVQWIASTQWRRVRDRARVALVGDFPFVVALDSADIWARQQEFRFDATVGAPPDAFSADGQDWGLPPYRWDVVAASGFEWLTGRARRCASLFDGFRIDHVVGFYRTYIRPADGAPPFFDPAEESSQRSLGERVVGLCQASGAAVAAEDLGTIPDFVRTSLAALETPGYRVFRWEREWHQAGQPFVNPADYPARSIATSGTHDTTTLASWWEEIEEPEREQVLRVPGVQGLGVTARDAFGPVLHDALVRLLLASGSNLVILPIQDVFGWPDRINVPASVSPANWTYRVPWPVDDFMCRADAGERAEALREWCRLAGRGTGHY